MKGKNVLKRRALTVAMMVAVLLIGTIFASALQNTPYHDHSSGLKLKSESHFCGSVPGTGGYKTVKGRYITSAWVQINADGEMVAYDKSAKVNSNSTAITYASTSCFNNPLKSQSFPYGWYY